MRRLVKMFIGGLAVALVAGVVASSSVATPDPGLKITPAKQLQFGTVPIGTMVIKPVVILNRTDETLHYLGAHWPNFGYPDGAAPFPKGFWEVALDNPYRGGPHPWDWSGCDSIAPKSSCTLYFDWLPFEAGTQTAEFHITYTDGSTAYPSQTITLIGTGY